MEKEKITKKLGIKADDWYLISKLKSIIYQDSRITYCNPVNNTILALDENGKALDPDQRYLKDTFDQIPHLNNMICERVKYVFSKINSEYFHLPGVSFEVEKDHLLKSYSPQEFVSSIPQQIENNALAIIISQLHDCFTKEDLSECPMHWDDQIDVPRELLWKVSDKEGLDPKRIFRRGLALPLKDRQGITLTMNDKKTLFNILNVLLETHKIKKNYLSEWVMKTFEQFRNIKPESLYHNMFRKLDSKRIKKIKKVIESP